MNSFFLFLWLKWAFRLTLSSLLLAIIISIIISLFIYIKQGTPALNEEVLQALQDITFFWFPIIWSMTLLLTLFRGLKYIFNNCIHNYKLELLTCKLDETIEVIGYGDLIKVWRKWFMLMIWLVAGHMIIALALSRFVGEYESVFSWFDIYYLFAFVLSSGYFSFLLLANRCKRVKIVKC